MTWDRAIALGQLVMPVMVFFGVRALRRVERLIRRQNELPERVDKLYESDARQWRMLSSHQNQLALLRDRRDGR